MPKSKNSTSSDVKEKKRIKFPKDFKVVFHNDNVTSQLFVVEVLKKVFHKEGHDAYEIMMKVHTLGKGVAGIYTEDIAKTKANVTIDLARNQGFPLQVTVEEN